MFFWFYLIFILLFAFKGIDGQFFLKSNLRITPELDISKFTEYAWYEIASTNPYFEKNCAKVFIQFDLLTPSTMHVEQFCIKNNYKNYSVVGDAYVPNEKEPSKLKLSFFYPFYDDYWVLYHDKNYIYALVGSPDRENLAILSRIEQINQGIYQQLVAIAQSKQFATEKLRVIPYSIRNNLF
jgi:lipocalin